MADMTVANEILKQLGGIRFRAMTGANNFIGDTNSLIFKLPKAKNAIKYVKIILTASDLYEMRFMKRNGDLVINVDGVYNEQLQDLFTEYTGLYTHL